MTNITLASPEAIRAEQDRRLRRMLRLISQAHPAYRRRWQAAGVDLDAIRGVVDLERLPLTTKADYMAEPEAYRLLADTLPPREGTLWDVVYTTGTTTGRPTPFYSTGFDYYNILELQRRMSAIRGMNSHDLIANLYPLTPYPHGAFLRCSQTAMVIGAGLVTGCSGSSYGEYPVHRHLDEVVELIGRSQPTILWGVPSYLRRVLVRASELGATMSRVRMCAVSGEPLSEGMRRELKQRLADLGATDVVVNNSLGATEIQGGLIECCEDSGFHNPAPDLYYFEAVDEGGRRLPAGKTGLLALTHLNRRGTVLVRYVLGDLVKLTEEPCSHCGRAGGRVVSQPVRIGRLVKVRGALVNIDQINHHLSSLPGIAEYQVVLDREDRNDTFSMDALVVRVAPTAAWTARESDLADDVAACVKSVTNVTPKVEFTTATSIFDPEHQMKPVRFVDQRNLG